MSSIVASGCGWRGGRFLASHRAAAKQPCAVRDTDARVRVVLVRREHTGDGGSVAHARTPVHVNATPIAAALHLEPQGLWRYVELLENDQGEEAHAFLTLQLKGRSPDRITCTATENDGVVTVSLSSSDKTDIAATATALNDPERSMVFAGAVTRAVWGVEPAAADIVFADRDDRIPPLLGWERQVVVPSDLTHAAAYFALWTLRGPIGVERGRQVEKGACAAFQMVLDSVGLRANVLSVVLLSNSLNPTLDCGRILRALEHPHDEVRFLGWCCRIADSVEGALLRLCFRRVGAAPCIDFSIPEGRQFLLVASWDVRGHRRLLAVTPRILKRFGFPDATLVAAPACPGEGRPLHIDLRPSDTVDVLACTLCDQSGLCEDVARAVSSRAAEDSSTAALAIAARAVFAGTLSNRRRTSALLADVLRDAGFRSDWVSVRVSEEEPSPAGDAVDTALKWLRTCPILSEITNGGRLERLPLPTVEMVMPTHSWSEERALVARGGHSSVRIPRERTAPCPDEPTDEVLFHGTCDENATRILLESGWLTWTTNQLGPGAYLTPDADLALHFAAREAEGAPSRQPVLLVFRFPSDAFEGRDIVELGEDDRWRNAIKDALGFRVPKDAEVRMADVVRAPLAADTNELRLGALQDQVARAANETARATAQVELDSFCSRFGAGLVAKTEVVARRAPGGAVQRQVVLRGDCASLVRSYAMCAIVFSPLPPRAMPALPPRADAEAPAAAGAAGGGGVAPRVP